jgi:hypothetical protein
MPIENSLKPLSALLSQYPWLVDGAGVDYPVHEVGGERQKGKVAYSVFGHTGANKDN